MKTILSFNGSGGVHLMLHAETDAERRMLLIITERPRTVVIERDAGHHSSPPAWVSLDMRETPPEG